MSKNVLQQEPQQNHSLTLLKSYVVFPCLVQVMVARFKLVVWKWRTFVPREIKRVEAMSRYRLFSEVVIVIQLFLWLLCKLFMEYRQLCENAIEDKIHQVSFLVVLLSLFLDISNSGYLEHFYRSLQDSRYWELTNYEKKMARPIASTATLRML